MLVLPPADAAAGGAAGTAAASGAAAAPAISPCPLLPRPLAAQAVRGTAADRRPLPPRGLRVRAPTAHHRRTMGLRPLPVAACPPPAARHRRPTQAGAGPRRRRPGRSSRAGAAPPCCRLRLLGRLGSRIRALPPPTPLRRGEGRRVATSAAASTAPCTTLRPRRHTLGVAPAPVPGCRFRRLRSPCFRPGPAAARTCACATPTTTSKIAHRIVSATQRRRPPLVRALLLRAVHQSLAAARVTRRFHPWARWGALESLLQGSKEVQQARQTAPALQERLRP